MRFKLLTHALAVSLLDRFLSCTLVQQEDAWAVQLVAVACLSIAAKYEEVSVTSKVMAAFQVSSPPICESAHPTDPAAEQTMGGQPPWIMLIQLFR